jgi:hypothetical protein
VRFEPHMIVRHKGRHTLDEFGPQKDGPVHSLRRILLRPKVLLLLAANLAVGPLRTTSISAAITLTRVRFGGLRRGLFERSSRQG